MGAFTNKITTVNMSEMSDFERIDSSLKNLIVSIEETIPGSRGFGLSADISDGTPPEAVMNDFAYDLDEKVADFIPEIRVADIEYEMENGVMSMAIYVEANDEYEEDAE